MEGGLASKEQKRQLISSRETVSANVYCLKLAHLPGSDPRKVKIARMVWEQTVVAHNWIAERLQMRSAANVRVAHPPTPRLILAAARTLRAPFGSLFARLPSSSSASNCAGFDQ